MICLEVIVNGKRSTVAGVASAQTLSAEICTYPGLHQSWLEVYGEVVPDDQPEVDAEWLSTQLSVGDKVQIQLIESDDPSTPKLSRIDPTAAASDDIPCVCAFCGKDSQQTEGMVASRKAMICRSCICYLYEVVSDDDEESTLETE